MKPNSFSSLFVATLMSLACCAVGDETARKAPDTKPGDSAAVAFTVQGANYRFTIPKGFGEVTGEYRKWADAVSAMDAKNITHFTLIPPEQNNRQNGKVTTWAMLKTPQRSIGKTIPPRKEMIQGMKGLIKQPERADIFKDATKLAGKKFEDVFGKEAKFGAQMDFVDADDSAIYLAGTATFEVDGVKSTVAGAGAGTVVRGNVFFYFVYSEYRDVADIATGLKQVKEDIRQFIASNPE